MLTLLDNKSKQSNSKMYTENTKDDDLLKVTTHSALPFNLMHFFYIKPVISPSMTHYTYLIGHQKQLR